MSIKNGKDYLYLIWKCSTTRRQYIVGRLTKNGQYEFSYGEDISNAIKAGFEPLISFEDLNTVYTSPELFPVFLSRLPDRKRKDINQILAKYGLETYDSYQLLKRSGAKLPIDNLQFIDPILNFEDSFEKTFYIAGTRHYIGCEGIDCNSTNIHITRGDEIFLQHEKNNPFDDNAICVIDSQKHILGYIPRYYNKAFLKFMTENRIQSCHVTSVNKNNCCDECIEISITVSGTKGKSC